MAAPDFDPATTPVGDEVRLRLPSDPVYGSLARIAATSLARRLGFGWRVVEDLGLVIDEAVILLVNPETGGDGLDALLRVAADGLEVTMTGRSSARVPPLQPVAIDRFADLVAGAATTWSVDPELHEVRLTLRPAPAAP